MGPGRPSNGDEKPLRPAGLPLNVKQLFLRKAIAEGVACAQWRLPVPLFDEAGNPSETPIGWWGKCSRCGEEFVTASSRVRRCERCRRSHR